MATTYTHSWGIDCISKSILVFPAIMWKPIERVLCAVRSVRGVPCKVYHVQCATYCVLSTGPHWATRGETLRGPQRAPRGPPEDARGPSKAPRRPTRPQSATEGPRGPEGPRDPTEAQKAPEI